MKRFFSKGSPHRSREDIEKEAAAELAAATGLGVAEPAFSQAGTAEAPPPDK